MTHYLLGSTLFRQDFDGNWQINDRNGFWCATSPSPETIAVMRVTEDSMQVLLRQVINRALPLVPSTEIEEQAQDLSMWMALYGGERTCQLMTHYGRGLEGAILEVLRGSDRPA